LAAAGKFMDLLTLLHIFVCIYIAVWVEELRRKKMKCQMKMITVGKGKIKHILYADDNVMLAETDDDL
jgi:hypothetical protein